MNATTLLLIAAAYYVLFVQPSRGARAPLARPGVPTAGFISGPEGTTVNIPGLGAYRTSAGGTMLQLDPNFISRLFPGGASATTAAPEVSAGGYRPFPGFDAPRPGPSPFGVGGIAGGLIQESPNWRPLPDFMPLQENIGGAYDAYRAGERDLTWGVVNVPIGAEADPGQILPVDPGSWSPGLNPCEVDPAWCNLDVSWFG